MDTTAAPAPSRSLPRRILDTFVSPGELFAGFGERPPWVGPLLIATVVTVAVFALVPEEIFLEQIREQLRDAPRGAGAPDPETLLGFARVAALATAAFSAPITALLVAGVLTLIFRVFMGGTATFRRHLGVAAHASLIPALGALLTLPLWIATGNLQTRLSLALLTPFLQPDSFLYRLLQGLEVFTLWWIAVLALGAAVLNRNIGWGKAFAILFAVYLVLVAGFALIPR